jgi:Tfp pilus assembly protein PilF
MATRLSPGIVQAYQNWSLCLIEKGDPQMAQQVLINGTQANPYTGDAFINMAHFCASHDDLAGARLWMAKATAADPDNPKTHREYAAILLKTGDREKAAQEFAKSLNLNPLQPDVSAVLTELKPMGSQLPPQKPQTK